MGVCPRVAGLPPTFKGMVEVPQLNPVEDGAEGAALRHVHLHTHAAASLPVDAENVGAQHCHRDELQVRAEKQR